ncbi:hypothetical protein [Phenylobacterium sp.]|uniref:hypothetical protein n=1 Tax=Phenylobacterium sp. TaxID=1871053 RepID=UPI00261E531B|nr:hypothetical protein [Phenylobacterium sp.]
MADPASTAARREAVLQRVQQVLLAVTEDLADAVASTADEDKKARLANALYKITRGLRQSIYLEAKLEREDAEAREAAVQRAISAAEPRIVRRRAHIESRIERRIWDEYDAGDDDESALGDELIARAEEWLDEASEAEGFLDESLESLVGRLCAFLGLHLDPATEPRNLERHAAAPAWPNSS